jgi:hypothetical protein
MCVCVYDMYSTVSSYRGGIFPALVSTKVHRAHKLFSRVQYSRTVLSHFSHLSPRPLYSRRMAKNHVCGILHRRLFFAPARPTPDPNMLSLLVSTSAKCVCFDLPFLKKSLPRTCMTLGRFFLSKRSKPVDLFKSCLRTSAAPVPPAAPLPPTPPPALATFVFRTASCTVSSSI